MYMYCGRNVLMADLVHDWSTQSVCWQVNSRSLVAAGCNFLDELGRTSAVLVRAECVRQRNEVAIKLGIIFLSLFLSRRLLKTIEGGVVGF